jgi:integrase
MERKNLTTLGVKALKPRATRYEQRDYSCPGLYVSVFPTGAKSWVLRFRDKAGRPVKLTLGVFSDQEISGSPVIGQPLTLASARLLATELHRRRAFGDDIAADHKRKKTQQAEASANTFGSLVTDFLSQHAAKTRNFKQTARVLGVMPNGEAIKRGLYAEWGARSLTEITASDIFQVMRDCRDRPVPGQTAKAVTSESRQRRVLSALSVLFGWGYRNRRLETNPAAGLPRPAPCQSRDRVLTDQELAAIWNACEGDRPFGDIVRFLILTGCRLNEAAKTTWAEIDGSTWTLPSERSKNHRALVTALPVQAQEILDRQGRRGPYVFTVDGARPFGGFGKAKRRLDALSQVEGWVLHDLRRSMATHCAELGVSVDTIELLLNHRSGVRGGIVGTYNRSERMAERRAALQRWGDHVEDLVAGREAVVVPLRRA